MANNDKNIERIKSDIEDKRNFLQNKYGATTDRELFKELTKEQKSKIFDWIEYQNLYSLREGYVLGKESNKPNKMTSRIFNFIKEEDNRWYVVLPEWEGDKEELEMVAGADVLLDIISDFGNTVSVKMSEEPFDDSTFSLNYLRDESEGGWYEIDDYDISFELWLCHVTKFVFGYLPQKIYCKH